MFCKSSGKVCRENAESRSLIVMPRFKRGIQYAVLSRIGRTVSGILDRPVKPGDDARAGCLTIESEIYGSPLRTRGCATRSP
jgi:hypothetical protein